MGSVAVGMVVTGWGASSDLAGDRGDEQEIIDELKVPADPTIMKRRLWLETEWNKYTDGHHDIEETLAGVWAWRLTENQEWGVRLKVPYDWHVAGGTAGDSDDEGLGDLKASTGTAFRLGESWRLAGGLELRMPTADEDLGGNDWRLQEFVAAAWDATRWLTLSPSAEYNQSLEELHGALPQHYLEAYAPATWVLPHYWSLTAQYEIKVDFEADNDVTHSGKVLVAKQFKTSPVGLALSIKRPFDSGEKEFQVNFILTYYFR